MRHEKRRNGQAEAYPLRPTRRRLPPQAEESRQSPESLGNEENRCEIRALSQPNLSTDLTDAGMAIKPFPPQLAGSSRSGVAIVIPVKIPTPRRTNLML